MVDGREVSVSCVYLFFSFFVYDHLRSSTGLSTFSFVHLEPFHGPVSVPAYGHVLSNQIPFHCISWFITIGRRCHVSMNIICI